MKVVYTLILAAILGSCYTDRKATEQVTKAILRKPALTAELTRKAFPCIEVKKDTFITYVDTIIEADCPDTSSNQYFTVHDTVVRHTNSTKTIKVKVPIQLPSKEVKVYVKDSADLVVANAKISDLENKVLKLEEKNDKKTKYIWWLAILAVILAGINYLQWKKSR